MRSYASKEIRRLEVSDDYNKLIEIVLYLYFSSSITDVCAL